MCNLCTQRASQRWRWFCADGSPPCRIEAIIDFLRIHTPSTKVVVLGLTPRGVWSPESRKFEWPSVYTMPIDALNHILHRLAAGQDTVHYVDCGDKLLANSEVRLDLLVLLVSC